MGQPKNISQNFKNPGEGAIEFAIGFVKNKTRAEALPIIKRLLQGDVHDAGDKRIKRCAYCGYYYRDQTKPNNSKTCSQFCKTDLDTLRRKKKNADKALLTSDKSLKKMEKLYVWWLDYPFWISEREMINRSWKHEKPVSSEKLAMHDAAKQRDKEFGGKRAPKR
ncbi:hypothetical protein [Bacillus velezensis]|uniref:hypothetical protein n=1 Tax=Bacillus velezensis TaxID=492670 RepID=UPI002102636C|nr:hypothetical protein [Bacillus velezensis]UTY65831.1 hypothetical protein NN913_16560 [Bacillus velezensis]